MCGSFLKILLLSLLLSGLSAGAATACTIFTLVDSGRVLFGNNEDFILPTIRMWFVSGGKDFYSCMYVGFNNGFAQGGMNEKGLAFDWVAGYQEEYTPSSKLKKVRGNASERMLETCATVDDVIRFYKKHSEPAFSKGRLMVADKAGNSLVIRARNGKLEHLRTDKNTVLGYGEQAFWDVLPSHSTANVENAMQLLKNCVQSGQYGTKYSTIYDLKNGDIYAYSYADFSRPVKLNFFEEAHKGEHYYDIPILDQQLLLPSMPLLPNIKRLYAYSEPLANQNDRVTDLVVSAVEKIKEGDFYGIFTKELEVHLSPYLPELQNAFRSFGQEKSVYAINRVNNSYNEEEFHYVITYDNARILLLVTLKDERISSLDVSVK